MAQNKNALIRYKTIDQSLQNRQRKWTLEDLIEACSDALYEYEGKDVNVSKRTVQHDIQIMRSDKLGYNAPIEVYEKKYYRYAEEGFSIKNIPLTESDMDVLSETVEMLKQFKDFSLFSELGGIIQRLEDKVYTEKTQQSSIIHLDKNENLKGLEYLDVIYQSILKKICLDIVYQSFKARESSVLAFHPLILKEYNNRWFVVGRPEGRKDILTLALDRIIDLQANLKLEYDNSNFDGDVYYRNTIGVTVLNHRTRRTCIRIDRYNAPYVITKPFHHSQKVIEELEDGGIVIELFVEINYEFERLILGFGDSMEVLQPRGLRKRIMNKMRKAHEMYQAERQ